MKQVTYPNRRSINAYIAWTMMDGPLTVARSMMKRGIAVCVIREVLFMFRMAKGI